MSEKKLLDGVGNKIIRSIANTYGIVPNDLIKDNEKELDLLLDSKKKIKFNKVNSKKIMKFIDEKLDVIKDTYFTGLTYFSLDLINEIKKIARIMSCEEGSIEYEIFENEENEGDFPLIIKAKNYYFILAPKNAEKLMERLEE